MNFFLSFLRLSWIKHSQVTPIGQFGPPRTQFWLGFFFCFGSPCIHILMRKLIFMCAYDDGSSSSLEIGNGAVKQRQTRFNPWMCRIGFRDQFCGTDKHLTMEWKLIMAFCRNMFPPKNNCPSLSLVFFSFAEICCLVPTIDVQKQGKPFEKE